MNINVWAVTIEAHNQDDPEAISNRIVIESEVTKKRAEEIATIYRDLGYQDVRVESWA